ncbi:MAG: archaeosortase/exosortase family protein, partial [archaeon]
MQKEDAVKGGKFLLILVISYVILSVLIELIPLKWIELLIAKSAAIVLTVIGLQGEIVFQEPVLILFENFSIQISYLCTGLMEFILLASAVIATAGISKEKKVLGVVGAGIATFLFNVARIVITVSLITGSSPETIELA